MAFKGWSWASVVACYAPMLKQGDWHYKLAETLHRVVAACKISLISKQHEPAWSEASWQIGIGMAYMVIAYTTSPVCGWTVPG